MHLVKGNIKFSPIAVNKLFKTISGSGEEITMTELHAYLNSTKYPEIVEGLKMFISSYLDDNHNLSLAAFLDLHEALYAAAPQYFEEIMSSIWSVKH